MPQLETGLFIFMLIFSFGFMIWGFLRHTDMFTNILRLVSIAAFFGLCLYMQSGYEVSAPTTTEQQVLDSNNAVVTLSNTESEVLIPSDSATWLGWGFFGFAILNMILLIRGVLN